MKKVSINTIWSGVQWKVDLRYFFSPRKTVHQMDIRECYLMGIWSPFSSRTFLQFLPFSRLEIATLWCRKQKNQLGPSFFRCKIAKFGISAHFLSMILVIAFIYRLSNSLHSIVGLTISIQNLARNNSFPCFVSKKCECQEN